MESGLSTVSGLYDDATLSSTIPEDYLLSGFNSDAPLLNGTLHATHDAPYPGIDSDRHSDTMPIPQDCAGGCDVGKYHAGYDESFLKDWIKDRTVGDRIKEEVKGLYTPKLEAPEHLEIPRNSPPLAPRRIMKEEDSDANDTDQADVEDITLGADIEMVNHSWKLLCDIPGSHCHISHKPHSEYGVGSEDAVRNSPNVSLPFAEDTQNWPVAAEFN